MKASELKNRVMTNGGMLIDKVFDTNSIQDKMMNGLLRTVLKANINKFDNVLGLISDSNGDIILDELENMIPEKIDIDLTEYASRWSIPSWMIPNKIVLLTKNDILEIIKG